MLVNSEVFYPYTYANAQVVEHTIYEKLIENTERTCLGFEWVTRSDESLAYKRVVQDYFNFESNDKSLYSENYFQPNSVHDLYRNSIIIIKRA